MLSLTFADDLGALVDGCADVLAVPPADPLAPEWISTPTSPIRRWSNLELARRLGATADGADDGICANIVAKGTGGLRRAVLDAGHAAAGTTDAWTSERVVWTLQVLAAEVSDDVLPAGPGDVDVVRWALHTASLFGRYQLLRPDLVRAWLEGADVAPGGDGRPVPLRSGDAWQPRAFRALAERIGQPNPVQLLPDLLERVRDGSLDLDLPERLIVFGSESVPGAASFVELVGAVATHRDVHWFVLDPAPGVAVDDWFGLTRAWGAATRGLRQLLEPLVTDPATTVRSSAAPAPPTPPTTLLDALQRAVTSGLVTPVPVTDRRVDATDDSVQLHGCHGPRRQVEVLRDVLLGLLADHDDLREEDVVVCCGDLGRAAPVIRSVLGAPATDDEPDTTGPAGIPRLRYRIEGDHAGGDDPVATAVRAVLDLVTSRFRATEVLGFCELPAVRERWGFTDEDLAAIRRWITDLRVTWGFGVDQRVARGVPESVVAGTWRRALDRLALGVTTAHDDVLVGDALLPSVVEGDTVDLLGRFTDLVQRLADLATTATTPRPVTTLLDDLDRRFRDLVAAPPDAAWQLEVIDAVTATHGPAGERIDDWVGGLETSLIGLRPLLLDRLGGDRRRGGGWGGVTFATLGGLRGVPHRVVAVLGMDDDALPSGRLDGDDLLESAPQPTDPNRHTDALGALLASVCAARDHLVVTYDAADVRTNEPIPRGIVLSDLADALEAVGWVDGASSVVDAVTVLHPRHATDARCFTEGGLVAGRVWGFDPVALAGVRARAHRAAGTAVAPVPSSDAGDGGCTDDATVVALDDVVAFLSDPAKYVTTRVLGVHVGGDTTVVDDRLPVKMSHLDRFAARAVLLEARLAGRDPGEAAGLLRAGDGLPVGLTGEECLVELDAEAQAIAERAHALGVPHDEPERRSLRLVLGDGRWLEGSVACHEHPTHLTVADVGAQRLRVGHELAAWVRLLALHVASPHEPARAVVVHHPSSPKASEARDTVEIELADDVTETARRVLTDLARLVASFETDPTPLTFAPFTTRGGLPFDVRLATPGAAPGPLASAWQDAARYADELAYLADGRDPTDLVAVPARSTDPGPPDETFRIARVLRFLNDAWHATVRGDAPDPTAGGDGEVPA